MTDGYTKEGLRQLAAEHGHRVSDVQLGRWHRFGLLPKPSRRWLGKGRGSKTIYPSHTADQLLRLLELRKEKHERRHHYLAWYLWWDRYDVPMHVVRESLESVAGQWDGAIAKLQEKTIQDLIEEPDFKKRASPDAKLVGRTRRRTGRDKFPDVAAPIMQSLFLSSGVNPDVRAIAEGFGFEFLFDKPLLDQKLLSVSLANEVISNVRVALSVPLSKRLEVLSDTDLFLGRDLLQMILGLFRGFEVLSGQLVDKKAAQTFTKEVLSSGAKGQAVLLLFLELFLHSHTEPSEGAHAVAVATPVIEFLEQLMNDEDSALVQNEILTTRNIKVALHSVAQLKQLLEKVANYEPRKFEEFLNGHPEVRQSLNPEESTNKQKTKADRSPEA